MKENYNNFLLEKREYVDGNTLVFPRSALKALSALCVACLVSSSGQPISFTLLSLCPATRVSKEFDCLVVEVRCVKCLTSFINLQVQCSMEQGEKFLVKRKRISFISQWNRLHAKNAMATNKKPGKYISIGLAMN